jgi:hypothetical protein
VTKTALASLAVLCPTALLCAQAPTPPTPPPTSLEQRLQALEERDRVREAEVQTLRQQLGEKGATGDKKPKWHDKLSIRGYGQIRFTSLLGEDNTPDLNVPNDRSVAEAETVQLRRGRVILSGDVSDHLFVYAQADFAGSTGAADQALQMRDFYGDIALDAAKEHRFRIGTSKVPYGWVNLQSSQNRAAIERPDALNSAVEGERDLGVYYYWAPKVIRARFADLVRSGLKGSGDYGVVGIGAYNGQGLNRSDRNGEPHVIARASYPFELASKQIVELGAYGYQGRYVVSTAAISGTTPVADDDGNTDERIGATLVWYPQPFGLEAEWTWGRGPQLTDDRTRIATESLQGGYVQACWRAQTDTGTWLPFARWNFFDGARKFATNAPRDEVNELDLGLEWAPVPEIEVVAMYTHTFWRTDTGRAPFDDARGDDRIGVQVQVNF